MTSLKKTFLTRLKIRSLFVHSNGAVKQFASILFSEEGTKEAQGKGLIESYFLSVGKEDKFCTDGLFSFLLSLKSLRS